MTFSEQLLLVLCGLCDLRATGRIHNPLQGTRLIREAWMKRSVCLSGCSRVLKTDAVARFASSYSAVLERLSNVWQQPSTFRLGIDNISVLIKLVLKPMPILGGESIILWKRGIGLSNLLCVRMGGGRGEAQLKQNCVQMRSSSYLKESVF